MPARIGHKGPFEHVPSREGVIAKVPCRVCERTLDMKVSKGGWPYAYCSPSQGCGDKNEPKGVAAAQSLLNRVEPNGWCPGARKACDEALGAYGLNLKKNAVEPAKQPDAPTPEIIEDKSKRKSFLDWKLP